MNSHSTYLDAHLDVLYAILRINKDGLHFVEEDLHSEPLTSLHLYGFLCALYQCALRLYSKPLQICCFGLFLYGAIPAYTAALLVTMT